MAAPQSNEKSKTSEMAQDPKFQQNNTEWNGVKGKDQ